MGQAVAPELFQEPSQEVEGIFRLHREAVHPQLPIQPLREVAIQAVVAEAEVIGLPAAVVAAAVADVRSNYAIV